MGVGQYPYQGQYPYNPTYGGGQGADQTNMKIQQMSFKSDENSANNTVQQIQNSMMNENRQAQNTMMNLTRQTTSGINQQITKSTQKIVGNNKQSREGWLQTLG